MVGVSETLSFHKIVSWVAESAWHLHRLLPSLPLSLSPSLLLFSCVCVCVQGQCAPHCTVLAQCGGWSHLLAAANSKREGVVQRDRLHSDWLAQCLVSCESQRERQITQ